MKEWNIWKQWYLLQWSNPAPPAAVSPIHFHQIKTKQKDKNKFWEYHHFKPPLREAIKINIQLILTVT